MRNKTKILIILLSVVGIAIILAFIFAFKKSDYRDITKLPNFISGHQSYTDFENAYEVTQPNTELDEYDVLILWGGLNYADSIWMEQNTPDSVKERYLVIYLEYYDSRTNSELLQLLKDKIAPKAKSFTFGGFSRGGRNVMSFMNHMKNTDSISGKPIMRFLLIDPSIENNLIDSLNYKKTTMTYGSTGMLGLFNNAYQRMKANIERDKGIVDKQSQSHNWFVPYTLNKYL